MKKLIIFLAVVAVAAVAGMALYRGGRSAPDNRMRVSGNIELTEVNIAFKTAGKLTDRAVDEGDRVTRGMLVARLDSDQLLKQRQASVAALAEAQSLLAQSETALEWQKQSLQADMEARNADLSTAESHLLELKRGARPQEVQEAKAAVQAADAELNRAQNDWERAQRLHKDDDISTAQFDLARARYESAVAMLRQARERSALVVEGPRVETIEAASAQVQRAKAGVKGSQANQLELKRREQEITARRAEIDRARAQLAFIDTQLKDTQAVSPIDGVVLVKAADPGEVLAPGSTVVSVGDIDHPWLRAYINEKDLGRVKLGSKVKVTTDAFPGKVYDGRVSFIASEAEFTPKQIQTSEERVKLVYRIKIDVKNPNDELKSNMPADAEILSEN